MILLDVPKIYLSLLLIPFRFHRIKELWSLGFLRKLKGKTSREVDIFLNIPLSFYGISKETELIMIISFREPRMVYSNCLVKHSPS